MNIELLAINISLMALFLAIWVGIPMWMVIKRPDRHPRETRTIPVYLRARARTQVVNQASVHGPVVDTYVVNIRELQSAGTR